MKSFTEFRQELDEGRGSWNKVPTADQSGYNWKSRIVQNTPESNQIKGVKDVVSKIASDNPDLISKAKTAGRYIAPRVAAGVVGAASGVGVKTALNTLGSAGTATRPSDTYSGNIAAINARQKNRDATQKNNTPTYTPSSNPILKLKDFDKGEMSTASKLDLAIRGKQNEPRNIGKNDIVNRERLANRAIELASIGKQRVADRAVPAQPKAAVASPAAPVRQAGSSSERKGSASPSAPTVAKSPVASKPAAPVSSGKPVTAQKPTEADPNLNSKYQVGVTATASKEPSGKMNFSNVKRGSTIPDNIQNMYNRAAELKQSGDTKRADIYTQSANRLLAKSNITQPAGSTPANPNLQSQMIKVAKSENKTGDTGKLFPSSARMPNPSAFAAATGIANPFAKTKANESLESVVEFLNKKSSWNRNSNIEIIEDIKIELNDLFNTLEESKYTNELLERKLKNVMERYSLTEDQLHYLISKFLDEGLLGGIAKWVGLPALGFLAATHGQDFINHFKNLQNKPSTEVSKEIKPAPELKEPISQKTLTAAKKSDKLNPKLADLTDVSKSVTSASDKATSGMEAASKKIDKMFGKKNK